MRINYQLYSIVSNTILLLAKALDPLESIVQDLDLFPLIQSDRADYPRNKQALDYLHKRWLELLDISERHQALSLIYLSLLIPSILTRFDPTRMKNTIVESLTRVSRQQVVVKTLLDHFGDLEIEINVDVHTEYGDIDIFIRLADRRLFALMLRTSGKNLIHWRDDVKSFWIYYRTNHKLQLWEPTNTILASFNDRTSWLRETKSTLLGKNAADRRKPIVRAIVLTGETRIDPVRGYPSSKVTFGRANVTKIDTGYTTYFLELAHLINFLLPSLPSAPSEEVDRK